MSANTLLQTQKTAPPAFMPANHAILQRQCACGGNPGPSGECAECRQKRLASQAPLIQPKLTIGQPNDKYEQEADRVADTVMRMPEPKVQRQPDEEKKEDDDEKVVQTKPIAGQITPLVQTQAVPNYTPEVTPAMEANINTMKGGGQPLDPATRAYMEPRFGYDFSQVRVHTDARAADLARAVNAMAYTLGQNVVFGAGQYAPQTSAGQRLMAHELTHVVQQRYRTGLSIQPTRLLDYKKPNSSPSDEEIKATNEYEAYMDKNLVWQTDLHMTENESLRASRLILEKIRQGENINWEARAREFAKRAQTEIRNNNQPACASRTGTTEHGCYCGAGTTCATGFNCPPADDLDASCRQHDMDYGTCSFSDRFKPWSHPCYEITRMEADPRFCARLRGLAGRFTGRAETYRTRAISIFC